MTDHQQISSHYRARKRKKCFMDNVEVKENMDNPNVQRAQQVHINQIIRREVSKPHPMLAHWNDDVKYSYGMFKYLDLPHTKAIQSYHLDWRTLIEKMNGQQSLALLDPVKHDLVTCYKRLVQRQYFIQRWYPHLAGCYRKYCQIMKFVVNRWQSEIQQLQNIQRQYEHQYNTVPLQHMSDNQYRRFYNQKKAQILAWNPNISLLDLRSRLNLISPDELHHSRQIQRRQRLARTGPKALLGLTIYQVMLLYTKQHPAITQQHLQLIMDFEKGMFSKMDIFINTLWMLPRLRRCKPMSFALVKMCLPITQGNFFHSVMLQFTPEDAFSSDMVDDFWCRCVVQDKNHKRLTMDMPLWLLSKVTESRRMQHTVTQITNLILNST